MSSSRRQSPESTRPDLPLKYLYGPAATEVFQSFIFGLVAEGHIKVEGKTPQEIKEALLEYMARDGARQIKLRVTIDHSESLQSIARRLMKEGSVEAASILYATCVEHKLNRIISLAVSQRRQDEVTVKQVIRDTSISAKTSWILALLNIRPLSQLHTTRIRKLADLRNAFVHYKWPSRSFNDPDTHRHELERLLPQIDGTLAYLRRRLSDVEVGANKRRILAAIELLPGRVQRREWLESKRKRRQPA